MNKIRFHILLLWSILLYSTCYIDDSTLPNADRLPFENFSEFFASNNAETDTLIFKTDEGVVFTTSNGTRVDIPADAFATYDSIGLEFKSISAKSDFILLNQPTIDGDTWLESGGAIFLNPYFLASTQVAIESPLMVEMILPTGMSMDSLEYYTRQDDWNVDNSVAVLNAGGMASFETSEPNWQMVGKEFASNGTADLTISTSGYGTIPIDVKAFVILSDHSVVIPLEGDIAQVAASGQVPTGVELTIVVMAMDNFILSVGTETLTINEDSEVAVSMNVVTVDEMITIIKNLD